MLVGWLALLVVLVRGQRRQEIGVADALRLLPDLVRLLRRIAADRSIPRSVRWRIWALLAYLALPIDLVPDFIPVLGYADDVVITVLVLRGVVKRAGVASLEQRWPGSPAGFAALLRVAGLGDPLTGRAGRGDSGE